MNNQFGKFNITPLTDEQLEKASRTQLLVLFRGEQNLRLIFQEVAEENAAREHEMKEKITFLDGFFYRVRTLLFRSKSERSTFRGRKSSKNKKSSEDKASAPKLPSERYPDAEVIEKHITAAESPVCRSCGGEMEDSGLTETSEYLTTIPKQFIVVRQHRHTYRCRCHGDMQTTPALPRIIPGGSYSDEMAIDVSLSKYCDLIPMERYAQMAKRQGFAGIPPQSLIGLSQKLADFFRDAYEKLRDETLQEEVLLADETPHKMLEGDEKKGWYLWGFSGPSSCFYECHPTRSGEIATAVLDNSDCRVLVSDVYSGYRRAIREANEKRREKGHPEISTAYCNAHARRAFKGIAEEHTEDALFMIDGYQAIYAMESKLKAVGLNERHEARQEMRPYFESLKIHAEERIDSYSSKSGIARSFSYFLKNYEGFTHFLKDPMVPIDNNASERMLRSPVVGRKTWYGTHSKTGAETACVHFSLVESCKLNRINPRGYYIALVESLHAGRGVFTPKEWAKTLELPLSETS